MYHLPCDFSYDFWFYIKAVEKGGQGGRPLTLSTQPFYLGFSASNKKSTSKKEPTSVFEITVKLTKFDKVEWDDICHYASVKLFE